MSPSVFLAFVFGATTAQETNFVVEYEWSYINFTWPTKLHYDDAIQRSSYIPENNAMAGIKYHNGRIFIAMPRIRPGVPVTLGYIPESSQGINPLIEPFPSWESNALGDCANLQSVQSMEIDTGGVMWVLDGFRVNSLTVCKPKLLLIDITTKTTLESHEFTNDICLSKGGFLNDLVVDETDGGFAYITDNSAIDPGLIVYSRTKNSTWKLRHSSMFPELNSLGFEVNGENFDAFAPIDGVALSPQHPNNTKRVFYCTLAGNSLWAINTTILKQQDGFKENTWRRTVEYIGTKTSQTDGMVMDNNGTLYYGLLPLYAVGAWNISDPLTKGKILGQNRETMPWVDSFAFNDKGFLYVLTNNIHKFFNPQVQLTTHDVKFRILKLYTGTKSYLYS